MEKQKGEIRTKCLKKFISFYLSGYIIDELIKYLNQEIKIINKREVKQKSNGKSKRNCKGIRAKEN